MTKLYIKFAEVFEVSNGRFLRFYQKDNPKSVTFSLMENVDVLYKAKGDTQLVNGDCFECQIDEKQKLNNVIFVGLGSPI